MKRLCVFFMLLLASSSLASAQGVEVSGGYSHISGDGGLDGFSLGGALWFKQRIAVAIDYDSAWDTSHLGAFELTQAGLIVTKNHLQNVLLGPRISFPGVLKNKKTRFPALWPFAEVQIGTSHLSSSLQEPSGNINQSASDNAFSWMMGGGVDYRLSPHWVARGNLDFLRTHFSDSGQSRLRLGIGIAYTFGARGAKEAAEAQRKADEELAAQEARRKDMEEEQCQKCKREAAEEAAEARRKAEAETAAAEAQKAEAQKKSAEPSEHDKQDLRARLLANFTRVLPTTDTPRGLVVDMDDVLFNSGKADLQPEGREDLAKLSGIVINYPSLRLTIEGHTDNTGNAEANQTLSELRANAVRNYLVNQGLPAGSVSTQGLGMNNPVADNGTPQGRQKNRRVEIIVSGEVIGTPIGQ